MSKEIYILYLNKTGLFDLIYYLKKKNKLLSNGKTKN